MPAKCAAAGERRVPLLRVLVKSDSSRPPKGRATLGRGPVLVRQQLQFLQLQFLQLQGLQRQPSLLQLQVPADSLFLIASSIFDRSCFRAVPQRTNHLWHPYRGTESSPKFGYDWRSRSSRRRRSGNSPLLSASRTPCRARPSTRGSSPLRSGRPQKIKVHPLRSSCRFHPQRDRGIASPRFNRRSSAGT